MTFEKLIEEQNKRFYIVGLENGKKYQLIDVFMNEKDALNACEDERYFIITASIKDKWHPLRIAY